MNDTPAEKDDRATVERLVHELNKRPLLWVGAGASVPAGFPTTGRLVQALVEEAGEDGAVDPSLPFPEAVDAFVAARGGGELSELLQREIGARPLEPTAFHLAVARLARAGCFSALVTINYDDLLETTLRAKGVPCLIQTREANAEVRGGGEVRVIKLHGTQESWKDVIKVEALGSTEEIEGLVERAATAGSLDELEL